MIRIRTCFLQAFVITALFNVFFLKLAAQDSSRLLLLDDAIQTVLSNNSSVRLAKLDKDIAVSDYKQANSIFLPQANFSFTAISTNNPLNAFGFKLEQRSITLADFNPDLLNHPSGTGDFTTKLEVQQPLLNVDMIFMRKAAAAQTEIYEYKLLRTKEYLSFETTKAYLQLQMAYDAIKVLQEALQTAQSVYKFTNDHYQKGLVQKSDLLNVQVQIATAESNLEKAKSNIRNLSDYLSLLMGQTTGIVYAVSPVEQDKLILPLNDTASVSSSRADLAAMSKAIEAKNAMIQSGKMSFLPRLNAFGSYQLNDKRMTGFGANAYMAGIQLSWNIFNGTRTKNRIATQTLERNKLKTELEQQKDQSNLELNKTRRDIIDAQFEIAQYKSSIEQASEALRILQNRYQQGLVHTTDVMLAATQLSQQKLWMAQAIYNQRVSDAYLHFLMTSENK